MQKKRKIKEEMKNDFCTRGRHHGHCGCGGAGYGLGFIGALVYYISTATSFWMGVLGVLKAIVWPAFVVYGLLKMIGA
jgi:hypothetical protein